MARTSGYVTVENERCTGCNICVVLCPALCLDLGTETNSQGYRIAVLGRPNDCTGCEICGRVCPHWAIEVYREAKPEQRD